MLAHTLRQQQCHTHKKTTHQHHINTAVCVLDIVVFVCVPSLQRQEKRVCLLWASSKPSDRRRAFYLPFFLFSRKEGGRGGGGAVASKRSLLVPKACACRVCHTTHKPVPQRTHVHGQLMLIIIEIRDLKSFYWVAFGGDHRRCLRWLRVASASHFARAVDIRVDPCAMRRRLMCRCD